MALLLGLVLAASGNVVFKVQNKFKLEGRESSLTAMRSHDARRHGRLLSAINLQLGGNGNPADTGSIVQFSLLTLYMILHNYAQD